MIAPTSADLIRFCAARAEDIYVRASVEGKWDTYNLTEIPLPEALRWIARWLDEGRWPIALNADLGEKDTAE